MGTQDHALFMAPDLVTTTDVTIDGGSWQDGAGLDRLKDRDLAAVARSTSLDLAATQFVIDFGRVRDVLGCVLFGNFSLGARTRATFAMDPTFATPTWSTDWRDVYPEVYPWGSLPWGHPSTVIGKPVAEDIRLKPFPAMHLAAAPVVGRYLWIEVSDLGNTAGYVQIGRAVSGPGIRLPINIDWGWELGVDDPSEITITEGGGRRVAERPIATRMSGSIKGLATADAMVSIRDMMVRVGRGGDVFFCERPTDLMNRHRISTLATFEQLSPIRQAQLDRNDWQYQLLEVTA
jgi:hypothetical protein